MKTLMLSFAAAALTLFAASAASAAPNCTSSFCKNGGNQCVLNGQTHTCGTCMNGGTSVLYVGAMSSADANKTCECQHNPSVSCDSTSQGIINNQPKTPRDPKKAVRAKSKAVRLSR